VIRDRGLRLPIVDVAGSIGETADAILALLT